MNLVLGGWNLNGIVTVQSGFPISITRSAIVNSSQNVALSNPTLTEWFNTSAFTIAPTYTYGDVGPVLTGVRTDNVKNLDAVVVKTFSASIGDHKITTQFRSEFYNLLEPPAVRRTKRNHHLTIVRPRLLRKPTAPRDIQFGLKVSF